MLIPTCQRRTLHEPPRRDVGEVLRSVAAEHFAASIAVARLVVVVLAGGIWGLLQALREGPNRAAPSPARAGR